MSEVQLPNLTKGERVTIQEGKLNITAGLGWKENKNFDLDAVAFQLKGGKVASNNHVAFYGNKKITGVELDKDNLTGVGEGDDERLFIKLNEIPADIEEVVIAVNIYQAAEKQQNFGMVEEAYVCLRDTATNEILKTDDGKQLRFDLTEDFSGYTAVLAAKLYRKDGGWKFTSVGVGKNGSVQEIANSF